ncbi:calnexin independence factor cif1 [Gigaspora margarita]|uniref:Calnexin independence factor cif1 n=1 Tax=Gigaspora margarita TaxID=4874 RepID=A0A8H3X9M4_GIGMA|nr:calnexin independence factor cif1 [Gigaspora margarita]
MLRSPNDDILPVINNITFDLSQHRIQSATRELSAIDNIYYLEREWRSIPLCPSDRISFKKNKIHHNISAKDLLIETLLREASASNNSINLPEIPPDFLSLVYSDIIKEKNGVKGPLDIDTNNKRLWIAFGQWLGLRRSKGPLKRKHVRKHLGLLWKKLHHAYVELQNFFDTATIRKSQKEKTQLIVLARNNNKSLDKLVQLEHIFEPKCITDLENPSHQSKGFWTNFIEHFGAYTRNNLLLFTSSNTVSMHNINHHECISKLFRGLRKLSESINRFLQEYYVDLYMKLSKLSWGPFAPRAFGVFPMIAINFNTISNYHWDNYDEPNSLCVLVALGDFEGGELCFSQLQVVVHLWPGQVVAFASRLLLHGNFTVTKGIRHSIVYFVHNTFFYNLQNFNSVYLEAGIEKGNGPIVSEQDLNNAQGLNHRHQPPKPKANQIQIPSTVSDHRQGYISMNYFMINI